MTEATDKTALLEEIAKPVSELQQLFSALDEATANKVPYPGSWTAAQLLRHVTKSNNGLAKAMSVDVRPAERDPLQRIPDLKKVFLDFGTKLNAPEFIIPEEGPFEKDRVGESLQHSFEWIKEVTISSSLDGLIESLPLGPITRVELLHFILYHTQRHLHQMKKICAALADS